MYSLREKCIVTSHHCVVLSFVYLFETLNRDKGRGKRSSVSWFTLPILTRAVIGAGKSQSPEFCPGFPPGWQGPNYLSHYLVSPKCISRKLVKKWWWILIPGTVRWNMAVSSSTVPRYPYQRYVLMRIHMCIWAKTFSLFFIIFLFAAISNV